MKVLTLALLFSLPVTPWAPQKPLRQPTTQITKHSKGGRWYFAATGHAVYCYGPVMTVPRANGDLQTSRHLLPRRQRRRSAQGLGLTLQSEPVANRRDRHEPLSVRTSQQGPQIA